jgi:hypothetical protein
MNFGSLLIFLELNKSKTKFLNPRIVSGPIQPGATSHSAWRPSPVAQSPRPAHARWRGGALAGGSVVAGRWQRAGVIVPGKAVRGGAHPSGDVAWRRWRMLRATAFIGGEGAPMAGDDGGMTLQCRCRRRKVRAASNGDNDGVWKGLTMKRRRRWHSDENRRGGGRLRWWEPARWTRRRWRRREAQAQARNRAE